MTDKTQAMDRLIAQDADLIDLPTQTDALREKINDIKEAWDWWQVDTYDRCASVVEDAINAALKESK
jgi:hypothetical protein